MKNFSNYPLQNESAADSFECALMCAARTRLGEIF